MAHLDLGFRRASSFRSLHTTVVSRILMWAGFFQLQAFLTNQPPLKRMSLANTFSKPSVLGSWARSSRNFCASALSKAPAMASANKSVYTAEGFVHLPSIFTCSWSLLHLRWSVETSLKVAKNTNSFKWGEPYWWQEATQVSNARPEVSRQITSLSFFTFDLRGCSNRLGTSSVEAKLMRANALKASSVPSRVFGQVGSKPLGWE